MKNRRQKGFTLMELIGVMAVLAILSAAMAPSVFELIDDAYAKQEQANLNALAEDLTTLLRTEQVLPSSNRAAWSSALAAISDLPVAKVLSNPRGHRRTLYFDPQFFTSSDSNFSGYSQTDGLSTQPPSPRAMFISDLNRNAPQPAMTSAVFNDIWDQAPGALVVESNDVKIARLNMSGEFHRVVLVNAATSQTGFSLENGTRSAIAANNGTTDGIVTRYVISGSQLELYGTPYPTGSLTTASVVSRAEGFRYVTNGTLWFWERT